MATPTMTLLAVVVESLHGCDWLTLSQCEPVPLLFSVCRLVNASRYDPVCVVREQAVLVLNKLAELLGWHTDNVPCKFSLHLVDIYFHKFLIICTFFTTLLKPLMKAESCLSKCCSNGAGITGSKYGQLQYGNYGLFNILFNKQLYFLKV